jgi:hypothetical protein
MATTPTTTNNNNNNKWWLLVAGRRALRPVFSQDENDGEYAPVVCNALRLLHECNVPAERIIVLRTGTCPTTIDTVYQTIATDDDAT